MRDSRITDAQLTRSSIWGTGTTYSEIKARYNSDSCWIPADADQSAWVAVDLLSVQTISAIVTQGAGVRGQWWTTTLYVQYDLPGSGFVYVQDEQGKNKVSIY